MRSISFFIILFLLFPLAMVQSSEVAPQALECKRFERTIFIERFAYLRVEDTYYRIRNLGNITYHNVTILIPREAYDIVASDYLGYTIYVEVGSRSEDGTIVYVFPRFELQPRWNCTFTLCYSLPIGDYLSEIGLTELTLDITFPKNIFPIKKTFTTLILPEGAHYLKSSLKKPKIGSTPYGVSVSGFVEGYLSSIMVQYEYTIFWSTFYPSIWLAIILGVISISLYWLRRPKVPVPRVVVVPPEVTKFVEVYHEKLALIEDLDSIEEKWRRREIRRGEYRKRKKMVEMQLFALDRKVSDLKKQVRGLGGRYADIIREIELAEARAEAIKASIKEVEGRYRERIISRDTYLSLMEEYLKRLEDERKSIDIALSRLQEIF